MNGVPEGNTFVVCHKKQGYFKKWQASHGYCNPVRVNTVSQRRLKASV